jgi:hypothetical protein
MANDTAGRFLSGLFEAGRERADKSRAEMAKQRDDEIGLYRDAAKQALQQGDTARASIAMKKMEELYKLPKNQSPFGKLGEFLQKVGKRGQQGGENEGQQTQTAAPAASGATGQPTATGTSAQPTNAGTGNQPNSQSAAGSSAQPSPGPGKASGHLVTRAFDKAARGLGTGLSAISDRLSPQPKSLPPLDISAFPTGGGRVQKLGEYMGEDGKKHIIMKRADNSTYEVDSEGKQTTGGSKFPRILSPISMSEAQAQGANGQVYEGIDGKALDLSRYNNNWQLVPIYTNGTVQYEPTSQRVTHLTVGNEVYAVPTLDQANLGTEGTALGQSRTGTTSLGGYTGVGDDNQIVRVPGQREPATPGATGTTGTGTGIQDSGAPRRFQPLPSIDGKTPEVTHPASGHALPPPKQRTASDPGAPGAKPSKSGSVAHSLPVPITLWNQQQQVARPVREGATQVFGDPTQPSLKSLKDYASIADDPNASARLAEAFNITFGQWDEEIKASGGLTHLAETAGGYPQLLAQLQASVREDAIGHLGSDMEKDYYDSVMSSYGAIVGLRSLTKASAASFSVTAIERELPLVGLNSFSTRQYYDQLSKLAEQVYNGTRTMVDQVMPADEKLYYKSQVEALGKLRDKSKGERKKSSGLPELVPSDPAKLYDDSSR